MPATPDYSKGLVYKFVHKDSGDIIYVGSTVNLRNRMRVHRSKGIKNPEQKLYKTIAKLGGWREVEVVEIEKWPCSTHADLRFRERHWQDILQPSGNIRRALLTREEQIEQHRACSTAYYYADVEAGKARSSKRYRIHHEAAKAWQKAYGAQPWTCLMCGCTLRRGNKIAHMNSAAHHASAAASTQ